MRRNVRRFICLVASFLMGLLAVSCQSHKKQLKVAASPVPHAEILEQVKEELKEEGIDLLIVEIDDYQLPNRLLEEKEVDANFFQHQPFLDQQTKEFHYHLSPLAKVHVEPLGVYSKKIHSLNELKEGDKVAIPSDPSNEARALNLLEELRLIGLKDKDSLKVTLRDINENPHHLVFYEVDAPFLTRALPDVTLAVIPANFALQAHLNPLTEAIALEKGNSPYVNILVVRTQDLNSPELQRLAKALTSPRIKKYIIDHYKGALIPAFN